MVLNIIYKAIDKRKLQISILYNNNNSIMPLDEKVKLQIEITELKEYLFSQIDRISNLSNIEDSIKINLLESIEQEYNLRIFKLETKVNEY